MSTFNPNSGVATNNASIVSLVGGGLLGNIASPELISTTYSLLDLNAEKNKTNTNETELKDVQLQTSTYGRIIPEVYGSVRIAGNIIWSTDIRKEITNHAPVIGDKGNIEASGYTERNYTCSFAIAICRGVIDEIINIYADGELISDSKIDKYFGTEDQLPNSLIQSYLGIDSTPAYRGLCYVVFRHFSLNPWNGRIPNFTFDIKRSRSIGDNDYEVENLISAVNIIPGSGEFVYDTEINYKLDEVWKWGRVVGYKKGKAINANNKGFSDATLSLEQLKSTLPNVQWVSVIVTWFCNSMNVKDIFLYPAVDSKQVHTEPYEWKVDQITRSNARTITLDSDGRPNYGGTISDSSLLRYLKKLKAMGYKVCLYPMIFVDINGKPWRGHITGNVDDVSHFFNKSDGYNNFIKHYAKNFKDHIDAFVIGSEMIGLTKLRNFDDNSFPAVDHFISLAEQVKNILHSDTIVTYAADWSEYHHTDGGWYNMDKLWSCNAIDKIGIDAYFPLTLSTKSTYDIDELMHGWESGEGYEFYYNDANKTQKVFLDIEDQWSRRWGWKNIKNFWESEHWNPDGQKTSWTPKMKKIWFTEYGFPSVDCCSNQPNVFYSHSAHNSGFPILSSGEIDFVAQKAAILATEKKWLNSEMIENKFLWCWDARPFPYYPRLLNVWSDGLDWEYGHWVNGKLDSSSSLRSIILDLIKNYSTLNVNDCVFIGLNENIEGMIVNMKSNLLSILNNLAKLYKFGIFFQNGKIVFQSFQYSKIHELNNEDFILNEDNSLALLIDYNSQNKDIKQVEILFLDKENDYQISLARSISTSNQGNTITLKSPVVMTKSIGEFYANNILRDIVSENTIYQLSIDILKGDDIKLFDIIHIVYEKHNCYARVVKIDNTSVLYTNITAVSILPHNDLSEQISSTASIMPIASTPAQTIPHVFETSFYHDNFSFKQNEIIISLAIISKSQNWIGCDVFYSDNDDIDSYSKIKTLEYESTVGHVVDFDNNCEDSSIIDEVSEFTIYVDSENGYNLFSQKNLALIGEEIVSFNEVQDLGDNLFKVNKLFRGKFGTEQHIEDHNLNEKFILLDNNIYNISLPISFIDKKIYLKTVSFGDTIDNIDPVEYVINGASISHTNT